MVLNTFLNDMLRKGSSSSVNNGGCAKSEQTVPTEWPVSGGRRTRGFDGGGGGGGCLLIMNRDGGAYVHACVRGASERPSE